MESSKELTQDMKARIIDKVMRVLSKTHQSTVKREAINHKTRLNFACPYCGDSPNHIHKKRCNVYWKNLYLHCYNCGKHVTLDTFLKDFDENFEGETRIDIINFIKDNTKIISSGESLDFYLFDTINKLALTKEQLAAHYKFKEIKESTFQAYAYLKSRLLHKFTDRFAWDSVNKHLFVFNLNAAGNVIGFQIRKLGVTTGPKYVTYNIEKIYNDMNLDFNVEESELDNLNKISMLFNVMLVNFSEPITIFEGPIDSLFFRNSIGQTGVLKHITDFDELADTRYFFDCDAAGKKKMVENALEGKHCFMWEKFKAEYAIPKKIKDSNELVVWAYKTKSKCLTHINSYYTKSHLDAIYI